MLSVKVKKKAKLQPTISNNFFSSIIAAKSARLLVLKLQQFMVTDLFISASFALKAWLTSCSFLVKSGAIKAYFK